MNLLSTHRRNKVRGFVLRNHRFNLLIVGKDDNMWGGGVGVCVCPRRPGPRRCIIPTTGPSQM